jgi:5-amino-6-(5-phosphoribosylamino)uracil reductase
MEQDMPESLCRLMMATTIDGKIATRHREAARFGSPEDRGRLEEQVAWADALVIAAGTVRAHGSSYRVTRADLVLERQADGRGDQPTSVVVSRSLNLPLDMPFFTRQAIPRLVATDAAHERVARATFDGLAEVLSAGDDGVDVAVLKEALNRRGMKRLLVLGGGRLNFDALSAGVVDEIYLTVSPHVYGGAEAPTMVDGEGFSLADSVDLRLLECERVGDEVFLRYATS